MTNPFKSFLNSLKNISSTWPSVLSAAVQTHRKLNGALACIERREMSWLLQQEQGALHLQGLERQEVLGMWAGSAGPEALSLSPWVEAAPSQGVLGAKKGPPGLPQSNSTGEQFGPRLGARLCFPGSHTASHRERDPVKSLQMAFLLALAKEGLNWGFRRCGISCTSRVMGS